jgi:hypothetical protein
LPTCTRKTLKNVALLDERHSFQIFILKFNKTNSVFDFFFQSQRGLSLLELQQMAADHHGDGVAAATVGHLEESVMDIVVHLEAMAAREHSTR